MSSKSEYSIFSLEKSIPTHCPQCAHPFNSNLSGDFSYDFRLLHPTEVATEWIRVFPEANQAPGLEAELVFCGKCHNVTLRVILAVRFVPTREEAEELERLGYANRREMKCYGIFFSRQPDYTLKVEPDPALEITHFTFLAPHGWRDRPRS